VPSPARPLIPGDGPQTSPTPDLSGARRSARRWSAARDASLSARPRQRTAAAELSRSVWQRDRVAARLPNDVDPVVAFLGAMRLGAIWSAGTARFAAPEKGTARATGRGRVLWSRRTSRRRSRGRADRADTGSVGRGAGHDAERPRVPASTARRRAAIATRGTTDFPARRTATTTCSCPARSPQPGVRPGRSPGVVLPLTILNSGRARAAGRVPGRQRCVCIDA
jgi:hypothetical protein